MSTNKRNGTTRNSFQIIRAVTRPCEHNTSEAFSINIYLTTKGDFISVHSLSSVPLLQENEQRPREPRPISRPSCQQSGRGVSLKGTAVLLIRDGSHTTFSFVLKQSVHPGNQTCDLLVASLHLCPRIKVF